MEALDQELEVLNQALADLSLSQQMPSESKWNPFQDMAYQSIRSRC